MQATMLAISDVEPARREPRRRLTLAGATDSVTRTIRVAVADGQELVRTRLRLVLERQEGIAVVGEAATGDEAVALVRRTRPDVVLMDVNVPGLDFVQATREMVAQPGIGVMLLSGREGDERIRAALRAGAAGLLLKDAAAAELVRAVRVLAQGAAVLSPIVAKQLVTPQKPGPTCAVIPLRGRSHRQHSPKEDAMLTPTVTEIRRGCARGNLSLVRPIRSRPSNR
jgi:DNA-binding NarL/FixJ family response regulator